ALLARQPSRQQILLLLSDGKPNDNDYYEGRYGIEDTRHALAAARRSGQHTFCVTIDRDAGEYLPHLFGRHGYTIVNRPSELPQRLALLYARMTRESR
ncbi:MAG: VWA domain-containing protein, partial [Burkholderiales bacterium]|nr:VWA domain-containing protein [Burkholderiales bacterium]